MNKNKGFTLLEIIIIVGIISIVTVMAVGISLKYATTKSVDSITHMVSSELNAARLQAQKNGLKFRTTLSSPQPSILRIEIKRQGQGNVFDELKSLDLTLPHNYDITIGASVLNTNEKDITFSPRHTVGGDTIIIRPDVQEKRCGEIIISRLGRVQKIIGTWNGNTCERIRT